MTPLAAQIAKQMTLPIKQRTIHDPDNFARGITRFHCFEISDVVSMVDVLHDHRLNGHQEQFKASNSKFMFLPADHTLIELRSTGGRHALLLEETESKVIAGFAASIKGGPLFLMRLGAVHKSNLDICEYWPDWQRDLPPFLQDGSVDLNAIQGQLTLIPTILAIINTPRIIGRRQHMPHAGLQRAIARSRGMVGKFPLHAWTEIKMEVRPPQVDDGEPHEARLTGARALHFCRAHLRVRLGRLEYVSPHWRGDPALGIKRSRYKLVMPKEAAPS